jgi:acetyl esterase/lipase
MKSISILICLVLVFSSCQKEYKNNSSQAFPAQTFNDVSYGSDAAQKMDIYLPAGRTTDSTKMILLVHGGAWLEGDKKDFNSYVTILKQRLPGYAIANINYRLANVAANHFPTQENDMKAALDFLVQKSSEYQFSHKFVLLGASAGAHMALLQAYKYSTPKIKAVIDFFGPTDIVSLYNSSSLNAQFAMQILLGGTPVTNPSIYQQSSPINFVDEHAPPTIIFHGNMDMVVNVSQSTILKNKLESLSIPHHLTIYPGLEHEFWPSAVMNDCFDKIEVFLKAHVQ